MGKVLLIDDEQAAMISHLAKTGIAFTEARSDRVDPEGIISASNKLQLSKLKNIELQLKHGGFARYSQLGPTRRVVIDRAAAFFLETKNSEERDAAFTQIIAALMIGSMEAQPLFLNQERQ